MKKPNNLIIPTVFEHNERGGGRAQDIYSKLLESRSIFLTGGVGENNTNLIVAQLLYLDSISDKDITLYINSPGGSVYDGLQVVDTIRAIKSKVSTVVLGLAASMGFVIAGAGTKGMRKAHENASFMMHQISTGMEGEINGLITSLEHSKLLNKRLMKIMAENTGQSIKKITRDSSKDYWLDSEEAIAYGVCDEIIPVILNLNDDND